MTRNFLSVLIDNRRLPLFPKVAEAFESLYRTSKGEVKCLITSAKELSPKEKVQVEEAVQKRLKKDANKLVVEYAVHPAIMGGLQVRLGDSGVDATVTTRLETLLGQLSRAA